MTDTIVLAGPAELAAAVADRFVAAAEESMGARGRFFVALAGGTTFLDAYRLLAAAPRRDAVAWARVDVFFGDERCVPEDHADRNDRAAREALLDHVPIPPARVHAVDALRGDAADRYESEVRAAFDASVASVPRFDLVLLGLGPDGHTASLFPGHEALNVTRRLVVRVAGSPKPPPERVTFTLPLICEARVVVFAAAGAGKREVAQRARDGDTSLPSGLVKPRDGRLVWLLDAAAAGVGS